ncbi:MAG: DUF1549 domain-containing protein, partial [Planctomycetales bacterium]|nr:DUF1549 domain-containing protein [Planctomycetales bacterium]
MPVSPIHRLAGPTGLALLFSLGLCNLASLSALWADDALTDAAPRGTPSPDTASPDAAVPDFNRDIRPLLSDNCYACHGFDQRAREADLRLDTFEGATQDLGGYAAIVPGKSEESELIARITASDSDELMPPADSHRKPLSPQSIELLRRWIDQGARWGRHWSFVPPRKADVPRGEHPVDYFVRQRLASQSRQLAPAAQPHTLIRRLALDLTGLPPSAEQTESFLRQPSETAWKHSVDQLLNSPHYGERLAMWWLDGARYSDTDGFQQDAERTNWPWRDWVVDAFNANMPFDQFTIEQFAGDLLPQASDAQKLATCFHRNHMNNGEGGPDP